LLFQVIKKVRVEQKLVLFYLVNDIVQHSAKKGFTELLDKFKSGIKESMPHLKEEKIAYKVVFRHVIVANVEGSCPDFKFRNLDTT
jgi:hypothetical protein